MSAELASYRPWYRDVSRYQWLVLLMASLGWAFDAFEGQLFVACMKEALSELVTRLSALQQELAIADSAATSQAIRDALTSLSYFYETWGFAAFLVGGAIGGSPSSGRIRSGSQGTPLPD